MAKNMSFLPEDYLQARIARRTNILCLTLFAVVMVGIVGAFFVVARQLSEEKARARQVDRQMEEAARRLHQLDELQAQKAHMMRKARTTAMLVEPIRRSVILAELINQMPTTLSLVELDLDTRVARDATPRPRTSLDRAKDEAKARLLEIHEPEIPPTEVTMSLTGVAPTDVQVAQFMAAIARQDLFRDVNLLVTEATTIEDQTMRKFRIELMVNPDVDLTALEPTLVQRELKQNPMGGTIQINEHGQLVVPEASAETVSDAGTGLAD